MLRPLLLSALLTAMPAAFAAGDEIPPWPVAETVGNAYVAGYGELLNVYDDAAKAGGSEVQKHVSERLGFYNQAISRITGAIDVGGKLYAGETGEAAVSAGLTVLGELAGSEAGKALLAGAGLTTAPVTAAIFALQVGMASQKELDASTTALALESLYGSIELDPVLRNRTRELGIGDPIPVTPEAVEHAWRKVYLTGQWREGFKAYVTGELGREWPEQSYWDRAFLPAGNVADEAALLERQDEYKGYIAGLISYLNKMARTREQFVLARRHLSQLQQSLSTLSQDQLLRNYTSAVGRLPEVRAFIVTANKSLPTANADGLLGLAGTAKRYGSEVLAFLPDTGKLGTEKQQLGASLRAIHDEAWRRRGAATRALVTAVVKAAEEQQAASAPSRYASVQPFSVYLGLLDADFASAPWQAAGARYDMYGNPMSGSFAPSAVSSYQEEQAAIAAHYKRQQESYLAGTPTEGESKAWFKAASNLRRADQEETAAVLAMIDDEVRQRVRTLRQEEILLDAELRRLQDESQPLLTSATRTETSLTGYCLSGGAGIAVPGYTGLTRYQFPKPDVSVEANALQGQYSSYLSRLRTNVSEAGVVSICGKPGVSSAAALGWLPALAASLREAGTGTEPLQVLRDRMIDLRKRMEAQPWIEISTRDYRLRTLDERLAAVVAAEATLKRADSAAPTVQALVMPLQTQVGNIENDLAYLSRLGRIVANLTPVMNDLRQKYRGAEQFSRLNESRYFLMRPGVTRDCASMVGQRPLMSAADHEEMWRDIDRTLSASGLTWLSSSYGLGLPERVRGWMTAQFGKAVPARDYIFLGNKSDCQYREPADLGALADALAAIVPDTLFADNMTRLNGQQQNLLSLVFGFSTGEDNRLALQSYDLAGLVAPCALALNYWNEPSRQAFARVCAGMTKVMDGHRDYLGKEAHYAEVLARIEPMASAFSNASWSARAAYDRDLTDPGVLTLYRSAAAAGDALVAAYASARADAGISPVRQAQLGRAADDVGKAVYLAREMVRNLELQQRGRDAGREAEQRLASITTFYQGFKAAYERKDLSRLMAFLGAQWQAADGTRLSDVEEHFRNMFNVFDEIRVEIGEVQVQDTTPDRVTVTYPLSIRGFIYDLGTEHEEESSITEVVANPDGGSVRILQTLQGRFWYK